VLCALLFSLLATPVRSADTLPLLADGGKLEARAGRDTLERAFQIPTPGVWYLWLKVTLLDTSSAAIRYGFDGVPVKPPRGVIPVPAGAKSAWVHQSAHGQFFAQVNADAAGRHTLTLSLVKGRVKVEKVALTLAYLARPTVDGKSLDHSQDPGRGRAYFPVTDNTGDGFSETRAGPPLKAERTFYVDADKGDDRSDGISVASAWKTLERVNAEPLGPGDAVLLKRGCSWRGGLLPRGSGAEGRPVTLGAWGEGARPVIDGGKADAVRLENLSHWVVRDLDLTSDMTRTHSGLKVVTQVGWSDGRARKGVKPRDISVINVVSHDNGEFGILVGSDYYEGEGYDGVFIENCLVYCNGEDGIKVGGTTGRGGCNTVIRYCTAYSNMTLAGIWIESAQNGLIERCRSYNNWCYNIWVWNAINVTIRYCEAWRGIGPNLSGDEGGFDIDWSCHACTIEYCYSHHNNGMGFLLMGLGDGDYFGVPQQSRYNIVRYCVSVDDNPGIWNVETWEFGKVYNNLIATSRTGTKAAGVEGWTMNPPKSGADGGWPADSDYLNNIFLTMADSIPLVVSEYSVLQRNRFDGNLYFRGDGKGSLVEWGGFHRPLRFGKGEAVKEEPPALYASVAEFSSATGEEKNGVQGDPGLPEIFRGEYGRLPLSSLRLPANSPAARAVDRVVLSKEWLAARAKYLEDTGGGKWGIPMEPGPVTQDYWGQPIPAAGKVSIGPGEPLLR